MESLGPEEEKEQNIPAHVHAAWVRVLKDLAAKLGQYRAGTLDLWLGKVSNGGEPAQLALRHRAAPPISLEGAGGGVKMNQRRVP